jgi:acetyltransferase-like isoleucine patch superfamily enzyme
VNLLLAKIRGEESTNQLRKKGLVVGKNFRRGRNVVIDSAHCWLIHIGDNVTLEDGAHILSHDATPQKQFGYTKLALVEIGDGVTVGARALIMPGVKIGSGASIQPGSVVARDVPDNTIVAGNPARKIGERSSLKQQYEAEIANGIVRSTSSLKTLAEKETFAKTLLAEHAIGFIGEHHGKF